MKRLSQGPQHCPVQKSKPRADNLAIVNLRSYSLRCTAASWNDSVNCLPQGERFKFVFYKKNCLCSSLLYVSPVFFINKKKQSVMTNVGIEPAILQMLFGVPTD